MLFPPEPLRARRRGRGLLPRVEPQRVRDPDRQRAGQPRHRPLDQRPAAAGQRRPGRGRALPGGRRAVVHDAVRARRADRRRSRRCASGRRSRSRPSRSSPRSRPTDEDPERDAEPGKILHELRTGEMARTGELPHRPYYGTVDATPLWLILFGATFDWTGDRALVDRLWPNALRALDWIDRYGDRDGDGFVEYERRTPRGLVQPGLEGLERRDPRPARPAGADPDRAGRGPGLRVRRQDAAGRARADARRRGPRAPARGGRRDRSAAGSRTRSGPRTRRSTRWRSTARSGRPTRSPRTPATACGPGSPRPSGRRRVVDRLMAPDMFSGWGIRTYASGQPGYNPIGYHTGTVWPHDVSLIAAGFKRYGRHEEANRLVGRDLRGRPALRGLPPARAVLRLRPRPLAGSRPVPRRLLAAGLGRRLPVPVHRDDARACARTPTGASSSSSGPSCRTGCRR